MRTDLRISARDFLRSSAFNRPEVQAARSDLRRGVYARTVPYTTRPMRPGEQDGKQYNFVSHHVFQQMIDNGEFIEWGKHNSHYYGTPRQAVPSAHATPSPSARATARPSVSASPSAARRSASSAHLKRTSNFRASTFLLKKHSPDEAI